VSCDNPFGGSIFARDSQASSLSPVPDPGNDVLEENAERAAAVLVGGAEREGLTAGTETAVVLAAPLGGAERSAAQRSLAFLKRWGKRRLTINPYKRGVTGMARDWYRQMHDGHPGSIAAHRSHVGAAAWIPEGLENRKSVRVLRWQWLAYHNTLGAAGVAFGNAVAAVFEKERRFAGAMAALITAFVLYVVFVS
jgi:hypothetical protein